MFADILKKGDTIGIVAPSHVADADRYGEIIRQIESFGFCVKTGANLYANTYGYLASEYERAADFNQMATDPTVKMVFFGGGDGAAELLPLLDYEQIKNQPKLYASYSDGTSILNAITAKTGLVTYYGQSPDEFRDLRYDDYRHFTAHFIEGKPPYFKPNGDWQILNEGTCEGVLIGGYTVNFALMLHTEYLRIEEDQQYILFLEDYESFNNIACVSMLISHIEQSPLIHQVSGFIFGHYSETVYPDLIERLRRFGKKHKVPVVYSDDFGHGVYHGILPIGCHGVLDTKNQSLAFQYNK